MITITDPDSTYYDKVLTFLTEADSELRERLVICFMEYSIKGAKSLTTKGSDRVTQIFMVDDKVIGIGFFFYPTREALDVDEIVSRGVGIHKDYRGKGYARKIFKEQVKLAKRLGIKSVGGRTSTPYNAILLSHLGIKLEYIEPMHTALNGKKYINVTYKFDVDKAYKSLIEEGKRCIE